ncbi:MAG: hypothetical protein ACOX15_06135 [Tepidanaerobacteraceae bacterium]
MDKKKQNGFFDKMGVEQYKIKKEYGIDLYLFLDAVSLGFNDEEIADLIGYNLEDVKKVRQKLDNVGSEIGLNYKKDLND